MANFIRNTQVKAMDKGRLSLCYRQIPRESVKVPPI